MIKIFRTIDGHIHQLNEASEGCWVVLANPTGYRNSGNSQQISY